MKIVQTTIFKLRAESEFCQKTIQDLQKEFKLLKEKEKKQANDKNLSTPEEYQDVPIKIPENNEKVISELDNEDE